MDPTTARGAAVLVHGAWHGAWTYERIVPRLAAAGLFAVARDLPAHGLNARFPAGYINRSTASPTWGADPSPVAAVSLDDYVDSVSATVDAVRALGFARVTLVGHSMGGVVLTALGERCPEKIERLVYLSAFMPARGVPAVAYIGAPENAGEQVGPLLMADPREIGALRIDHRSADAAYRDGIRRAFYGDLPADAAQAALQAHGASFFRDLQHDVRLLGEETEQALAELVAQGLVTCDTFAGLRALVMPAERRNKLRRRRPGHDPIDEAGRWSLTRRSRPPQESPGALAEPHVDHIARVLLRRYGVVFRRLLEREEGLPPWRDLHYVYRRLEARGEVRGGRFVSGFSGEQFALPEAATGLRRTAKVEGRERVAISAVDPLNLAGILTPGEKIPRLPGNRLLFEGGVPIAVQSGGEVRYLVTLDEAAQWEARKLLIRREGAGRLAPGARPSPPAATAATTA